MDIIEALNDPRLLGSAVKDRSTFSSWFALFKSVFGLPLFRGRGRNLPLMHGPL